MTDRVRQLRTMFEAGGLAALDAECSRILGCEPPDRAVRRRRKYRERPSSGTHGATLRRNRLARLYALGFR